MTDWPEIRREALVESDDVILALNKPAGISVTGERHSTDLVELAEAAGETLYPVHRIDKVTSGLVLFARDLDRHGGLTRQFSQRTVDKTYLMVTASTGLPDQGRIDLPLSAGRKGRIRIAAPRERIVRDGEHWSVREQDVLDVRTYPSVTAFRTLWTDDRHTVLAVYPVTGRRHQIRVHMAWIGHPVVGDPLFDRTGTAERTCLHSWRLGIDADWRGGERLQLEATPGSDFWSVVADRLADDAVAGLLAQPWPEREGPHDGS